uniref:Neurotensin/neuromedin N n=1 Tax=Anolis carolinensis TaxID=28377 RepID=A0A803T2Y0_ANOCA
RRAIREPRQFPSEKGARGAGGGGGGGVASKDSGSGDSVTSVARSLIYFGTGPGLPLWSRPSGSSSRRSEREKGRAAAGPDLGALLRPPLPLSLSLSFPLSPNFPGSSPPSLPLARTLLHGLCLLGGERMATRMLRMQLACAMLLAFASWSLGSDSEEEMKALEADLLTNMYTSKLFQQDVYDPENSSQDKDLMKRKTPYILKRQLHVNKARRPYILKRSSYY